MRSLYCVTLVAGLAAAATSAGAGTFVPIVPPSGSSSSAPFGITDQNVITGYYIDSSTGVQHGFVGPFSGTSYTTFDDGGGTTEPRAINDHGFITGYDVSTVTPWERYPTGKLKTVVKKGTGALNQLAQGINGAGVFTGDYVDSSGHYNAYLGRRHKWTSNVKITLKNGGGAARGINKAGDIVGWFYDSSTGLQHGLLIVGTTQTQIDYPAANYTVLEGINDNGVVSGQYQDSSGVIHGFYYGIKSKKFVSVDVSGATLTQVWGINNHNVLAVSSSSGGYAYCIQSKGCPPAPALKVAQHGPSKPDPQ